MEHNIDNKLQKVLAENLNKLMNNNKKITQQMLYKKSGVDQKTISNALNPGSTKNGPTLSTIALLAHAFELEAWHLLIPNQTIESLLPKSTENLISNYNKTDKRGKQNIMLLAVNEACYCQNQPKSSNEKY